MPLAKICVEWEGLEGGLLVGMLEDILVDMLVRNDFFHKAKTVGVVTHRKEEYCAGSSKGEESVLPVIVLPVPAGGCKSDTAKQGIDPDLESMEVCISGRSPEKGVGTLESTEEVGDSSLGTAVQGGSMLPSVGEVESGLCPTESNKSPGPGAEYQ
ncbi:unnamed protein product [Caretta caretta]